MHDNMNVEKRLIDGDEEELNKLKAWLFQENVRLAMEEKRLIEREKNLYELEEEIEERKKRLIREQTDFRNEMNALSHRITQERQRLKQDEQFFDKKMQILKNGFAELEADRCALKKEKELFDKHNKMSEEKASYNNVTIFFKGVTNPLALKKRYRDLIKIFHPDNLCGDHQVFRSVTKEYEKLLEEYRY